MSADDARPPTPGNAQCPQAHYHFLDKGHPEAYRRNEIQALVRAIEARENRLVLGLPDMGVSNLLRFLVAKEDLFKHDITFAYLDCDTLPDSPGSEAFFEAIVEQLHEQGLGDQTARSERGYVRLRRLVVGVDRHPTCRVAIVADKAGRMLSAVEPLFYRQLKALTDLNKRVCYIFAASPRSAETVDADNLLFAGRRLAVGRLNERDCVGAIAEEAQRLELEFDPATQARLARLSGGHPGLLRALSSAAAEGALAAPETALADRLLARGDVKARCEKLWDALDPAKQAALQLLAGGQSETVGADILAWLRDFGLVEADERAYHHFSPIFERFVTGQAASISPIEPVTIVGATSIIRDGQEILVAGKVFKGGKEVRVAPLELRLIACLKRDQKIYTKDDIAAYVYYDDLGEGVQDTAIENLIRQVRKRLGDQYIKTYYGQGYEFIG